jgi:hypothetical protein
LGLPLFAIGWAALAEVLCLPGTRLGPLHIRRGLTCAALLVLAALGFRYREGWAELEQEHRANLEQARAWNEHLPADAKLAGPIGWHHSVYVGRTVHSLYFAVRRKARGTETEPGRGADPKAMLAVEEVIDKYALNTVILSGEPSDLWMAPYFEKFHGPGVRAGAGWVFRVRP